MKKTNNRFASLALLFISSLLVSQWALYQPAYAWREIIFPVMGPNYFTNDFYAPRGDRRHLATDIIADKGQPLVAAVSGTIVDVQYPQPRWGYSVTIEDDEGWQYSYVHMNNDNPGTNDGKGGAMNAYAPDMREGNRVRRGQLLGWVGDSGYSNGIPHLHFEMYQPNGSVANPYESLSRATRISRPHIPGPIAGEILPYGTTHSSNATIAMGNFDADPESEFVVGAGTNGSPSIKVYDANGTLTAGFLAYKSTFKGGVDVATGDIDGDGTDEIITGPLIGGPHIRTFEPNGTARGGFFAFDEASRTGIKVAAGDTNGDGSDEIITSLNAGGEPRVKVFDIADGSPALLREFLAYESTFRGGVDVAAGNVNDSSPHDEIITATGPSGSGMVRVFSNTATSLSHFRVYGTFYGGVRVSVGDVDTSSETDEIITVPASKGGPLVKLVNNLGATIKAEYFMEVWWVGGYDIAAGNGTSKAVAGGNRRVSVRTGLTLAE